MSEFSQVAVALLGAGLLGTLVALLHRRLCAWADWSLMTGRARRRVALVQQRLPVMAAGSAVMAGLGLVLGLVDVLGPAG